MFLSGKDATLIVAVSGVTTLSVSFMLFFDELQINISLVGFFARCSYCGSTNDREGPQFSTSE